MFDTFGKRKHGGFQVRIAGLDSLEAFNTAGQTGARTGRINNRLRLYFFFGRIGPLHANVPQAVPIAGKRLHKRVKTAFHTSLGTAVGKRMVEKRPVQKKPAVLAVKFRTVALGRSKVYTRNATTHPGRVYGPELFEPIMRNGLGTKNRFLPGILLVEQEHPSGTPRPPSKRTGGHQASRASPADDQIVRFKLKKGHCKRKISFLRKK